PLRRGEWKSLLVGGQLFAAEHEFPVDPADPSLGSEREEPFGYTLWTQYQLARNLYLGARWDRTDFLRDDSQEHERIQPYVSWYTSEFFRIRAGYERMWSDDPLEDGHDQFRLEFNAVFGAHPPEPFWVNK
ncbi:MAG: hypothetical protein HY509_05415, partial [Acidobacteria bacterium]|nr:hypothetical protein [Acidobacteriota bacterium]